MTPAVIPRPQANHRGIPLAYGDWISRDGKVMYLEKAVRTVPYGFLGVVFGLYLGDLGFGAVAIGAVLALTTLSSAAYTFTISFVADRFGRKRTLMFFALMDAVAGALLFASSDWWAPVLAGVVGNMTVGAGEVGPYLSLEQAMLPQTVPGNRRTLSFSVYNLVGYGASSAGALLAVPARHAGFTQLQPFFLAYLASGLVGAFLYSRLTQRVESDRKPRARNALSPRARPVVLKLSALFSVDAFAGGFIGQSVLALYFNYRFGLDLDSLGLIFAATQVVTAVSFLLAERIARRIGLLRTMVFSHIPSNLFLLSVAFAPTSLLAVGLLLCRQSLSQMDVPTRQSYVMAIVDQSDRTAAAGITSSTRTVASSASPPLAVPGMGLWIGLPLVAAGTLKILYDVLIYRSFRKVRPPDEADGT